MKTAYDHVRARLPGTPCHTDRFRRCPQVLSESLGSGEVVLLHITDGQYFTLNETGSRLWNLLTSGRALDDVVAEIVKEYYVSPQRALDATSELVMGLELRGLLMRTG